MRKASMILGIVGGSLAIVGSLILVLVGLFVGVAAYRTSAVAAGEPVMQSTANDEAVIFLPHGLRGGFFIEREGWADGEDEDCPMFEGLTTGRWTGFEDRLGTYAAPYSAMAPRFIAGLLIFLAAAGFAGGVLGIVGGIIVKRKPSTGGVLMLVGAVLASNMFAVLLTGGVLALASRKPGENTENQQKE